MRRSEILLTTICCLVGIAFVTAIIKLANMPYHPHHYKEKVKRLIHGRYTYKDKKDQWWIYALKGAAEIDIPDVPWISENGSVRLPIGGTWTKGTAPEPEEIEGELEATIEMNVEETPEADTDVGADSRDSGSSDSGSDSGGSGGDGE